MSKLKSDKRDGGRVAACAGKQQFNREIEMWKIYVRKKIVSSHHGLELFKSFRSTLKTVKGIYLDILSFTYLFVGLSRLWLYIQMDISEGLSPDTFGFTAMNKIAIKLDLLQHFYKRFTSNCDNFLWIIQYPYIIDLGSLCQHRACVPEAPQCPFLTGSWQNMSPLCVDQLPPVIGDMCGHPSLSQLVINVLPSVLLFSFNLFWQRSFYWITFILKISYLYFTINWADASRFDLYSNVDNSNSADIKIDILIIIKSISILWHLFVLRCHDVLRRAIY